ncbi:MAG: NAD(P)/FAD-dependent oxidoreductase [Planctomycetota bacterium]|nr:MAG: NAD(P)/FAD-dependent oxidoreductase [Planctomycetota bacterium]
MNDHLADIVICGGGLAGLCSALQIKQQRPETRVVVIERQRFPLAEAAHKVGESSVEIGAHYFAEILGLRDHIQQQQLPKLGLRYFFGSHTPERLETRCEMGGNRFLEAKSYQLDRGRLENHLAERVCAAGVELIAGARVREIDLAEGGAPHRIRYECDGQSHEVQSRWIFDASGRASLLKRRLGLAEDSPHRAHAVWFRINHRLRIDDACDDADWAARHHHAGQRWLSTVHLMGAGYWVWFIPLASGATSVGIVCDKDLHSYDEIKNFPLAMEWLRQHEPLAAQMIEPHSQQLMDFVGYRSYSYGCKQVFSEFWALIGESGFFLDPFYSPGSDFIAMGNTMAVDLLMRSLNGESGIGQRAAVLDGILQSLFRNHLGIYHRQYPLFANAKVMAAKVVWDFAYYWAIPATLFFHGQLTNVSVYARNRAVFDAVAELGVEVQELFRRWHQLDQDPYAGSYVDVPELPIMAELNAGLLAEWDAGETIRGLRRHADLLHEMAGELRDYIQAQHPQLPLADLPRLQACSAGSRCYWDRVWQGLHGVPA